VCLDSSCVLLEVVVHHWIVVMYYYGSTQCSTGWNCSSCVLLDDFHGDYQFTLGVAK
jgi:hypothetical protein